MTWQTLRGKIPFRAKRRIKFLPFERIQGGCRSGHLNEEEFDSVAQQTDIHIRVSALFKLGFPSLAADWLKLRYR